MDHAAEMTRAPAHGTTTHRESGVIVGILFIVATAFLFAGEAFYRPILDSPDVLLIAAQSRPTVVLGLSLELICILAMPLIGAFIFPVLSRVSVGMAASYFFFRSFEAVILVAVALSGKLAILELSGAVAAGASPDSLAPALALVQARLAWADTAGPLYVTVFVLGALCLYAVLFRARLVPRWLSIWGLVSATVLGAVSAVSIFAEVPPTLGVALILPLAVQEMVMALWFILRGFDLRLVESQGS